MEALYKKMYAIVVGEADNAIQFLDSCLQRDQCCPETCSQAAQMLKDALRKAEELYLDAGDE